MHVAFALIATTVVLSHPAQPVHTHAELKKIHHANPACNTWKCVNRVKLKIRLKQWKYYKTHPNTMPSCTWYGESGPGLPQFSWRRYTINNGHRYEPRVVEGIAHGKYQIMPSTYRAVCKYCDWSRVDQEIAAHNLLISQGTGPWQAC